MNRALKVALLSSVGAFAFGQAEAADHIDSPAAAMNTAADITDVFAFTDQNDATKVNLIMNVVGPMFSDAVTYAFHVESRQGFLSPAGDEVLVICQFEANQTASCWAGDGEYVTGDASAEAGISSTSGALKVFAGPRNDPFFFNFSGFTEVLNVVKGAAGGLVFDGAGCPALDMPTSALLVGQLSAEPGGAAAVDDFAGANVASLVVQVDASLLGADANNPIMGIWASTHTR